MLLQVTTVVVLPPVLCYYRLLQVTTVVVLPPVLCSRFALLPPQHLI